MARSDLTHLYFLLDRSGSMQSIKADTEGGFAAFIEEQRKVEGECRATLAQFDDRYEVVYSAVPIADVPRLELHPRGSTALLDAMGRLVISAQASVAALAEDERPGTVIVAIMTDGHENASQEWTHPAIKALVEERTKDDWQFMYMGADQDAVEVGTSMGIAADQSLTYGRGKAGASMAMAGAKIAKNRGDRSAAFAAGAPAPAMDAFTREERARSVD